MDKRGNAGFAGVAISVVVGMIMLIAVAYPIVSDVVASANTTDRPTDALIIKYLPTFLLLVALVFVAGYLYFRGK